MAKPIFEKTIKFLKVAVIFVALASVGFLMGIKGLNQKNKQEENRLSLQRENERLQVEIKSLEKDLTRMRDSPQTIEKTAKRKLGMARQDETIYIFERRTLPTMQTKDPEFNIDKP